jgi:hypothetical protein
MLRSLVTHVSLLAVLVHLHWGGCTFHLPACEEQPAVAHCDHGHHHLPADHELPANAPAHDDCHESHASAAVCQAVAVPAQEPGGLYLLPAMATADGLAWEVSLTASVGRTGETCPLPLRASARSQVLLN